MPFDGGLGQIQSAMDRLLKVTRLLNVISVDDLLAAYPDCPVAYEDHKTALDLITTIEVEVHAAFTELESGWRGAGARLRG